MRTLLYLLYGPVPEYHLELTYSVLSAVRHAQDPSAFRIVLATDESTRRADLPVDHLTFSQEELRDWTIGGKFNHAAKIGILIKASGLFAGKVALLDTDTYFTRDPLELFDRVDDEHVVMHADEGSLEQGFPNYDQLIAHQREHQDAPYPFTAGTKMINSGVVGVSERSKPFLADAMAQTRHLVEVAHQHIHTLEQFSLGLVLGTHSNLVFADDLIRHYHGYERRFIHKRIKEIVPTFTRDAFEGALSDCTNVEGFPQKRKIDVLRSKMKGAQRRNLNNYAFAYLSYMSSLSARSPSEANAWAGTALDVISHNSYPRRVVAADFDRFLPENCGNLMWLDAAVRDRWIKYWQSQAD